MTLYLDVLRSEPDHIYALNGLGGVYADIGRLAEAEACFRRTSALAGGRAEAVRGLETLRREYEVRGDNEAVERIGRWLAQLGK